MWAAGLRSNGVRFPTHTMKKVWMDSGAFSAWSMGEIIALNRYVIWLKKYMRHIDHYAVLDVIGDPEATWANHLDMLAKDVSPVPCYHFGEDVSWLVKYMEELNSSYIAIGGMVGKTPEQLIEWLDVIWETYLTNTRGEPTIKVHGFGLTSPIVMGRYPWYSVDSSAWTYGSRARWQLLIRPDGMAEAITMRTFGNNSYGQADAITRKLFEDQVRAQGLTIPRMEDNYWDRNIFNVHQFNTWTARWHCERFHSQQSNMFHPEKFRPNAPGLSFPRMEMYLAGFGDTRNDAQIYEIDAPGGRMFSYHYEQAKINDAFQYHIDRKKS